MIVNRRLFLKGLGGACVAAPFLGSVAERSAKAQGDPVMSPPKRLIVMFSPYGTITTRWFPAKSHGPLKAEDYQGTTLEPLAPFAQKLLVPRGIRAMNEWTYEASLGQGNDYHTQVVGTYFTCVPIDPHTSNPFDLNGTETKFNAMPTAPSLDHVCAQQLSPNGLPLFLRVSGGRDSTQSGISYSASKTPFDGVTPWDAFAALTGLFQGGSVSPDSYEVARGKSVVDLVKHDLESLERVDMSSADKQKLAAWKELLHDTTGPILRGGCTPEFAEALALTSTTTAAPYDPAQGIASKLEGSNLDYADLSSNLAVLSALCDANRVIWLKYPSNYVYRGLGIQAETDNLNHRINGAGLGGKCYSGVLDMLLTIDRYHAEKFAHLVRQLDEIEEGDGKLLDNTATVWFHETSDGHAFNLNNMPILQAGSCGGYFLTGGAVNVDDGTSDLHRGNSEAVCDQNGTFGMDSESLKSTGTPAHIANAPINKYYCNLMNAIGIKAGGDGFPLVGGTEPVTHYGMYDRTEDFASGGELPPHISDPGEFEQLRA